jgi:hypothetical protein
MLLVRLVSVPPFVSALPIVDARRASRHTGATLAMTIWYVDEDRGTDPTNGMTLIGVAGRT